MTIHSHQDHPHHCDHDQDQAAHAHDHEHHGHGHDHGHSHGHSHGVVANADGRYLTVALLLLTGFMLVEVVVGIMAGSLALLSDAGHMLTDVGAIGLSLFAMRMAARPAAGHFTYGFRRVEILSAQANGITLLLLAVWFVIEAIERLITPPVVNGTLVTLVAVVGIGVNLLAVWAMSRANRQSLNVEGSFQHILTDLYAFIATAVAGAIIWLTGWNRVDALAALIVAALMAKAGYGLVKESGRIFLEAAPQGLNPEVIAAAIRSQQGVTGLADLHVWELTSGMVALSGHLYVEEDIDCHAVQRQVEQLLGERFGIRHTTLQTAHGLPESGDCCQLAGE